MQEMVGCGVTTVFGTAVFLGWGFGTCVFRGVAVDCGTVGTICVGGTAVGGIDVGFGVAVDSHKDELLQVFSGYAFTFATVIPIRKIPIRIGAITLKCFIFSPFDSLINLLS
jgi:hypothetical protein